MTTSLQQIPDAIRRLHADGRVPGANWTLAQIAEHLALTIDLTLGRVGRGEPSPVHLRPMRRFLAKQMVLRLGRIPPNVPTLKSLTAPAQTSMESALSHLTSSIESLVNSRGPLVDHPFLGPLSKQAWLRFHLVHARHHLARFGAAPVV